MTMRHSVLARVLFASASALSPLATAAVLQPGDLLTLAPGVPSYSDTGNYLGVASGSWFGVDFDGNNAISPMEKTPCIPVPPAA